MTGDHDYGGFHAGLDEFGQHFGAIHLRHLDVTENGVVFFLFRLFQALATVFGRIHLVILHLQDLFQRIADGSFVVYDENFHTKNRFMQIS